MARLPYIDRHPELPDYDGSTRRNISRLMMNSPRAAKRMFALGAYLREESRLPRRLREMAIVQIGYVRKSAYDYSSHLLSALKAGVPEADIRAIGPETAGQQSHLDGLTRAVLRAARDMTLHRELSDETFATLRQGLGDEQLTDLLLTISHYNEIELLVATLKPEMEARYAGVVEKYPFSD